MKNSKIRIIVPCVLAVIFLVAGLYIMGRNIGLMNSYSEQIARAEQALKEVDPAEANALEQDRRKALDTGMNDYMAKPIDLPRLLQILQKILQE